MSKVAGKRTTDPRSRITEPGPLSVKDEPGVHRLPCTSISQLLPAGDSDAAFAAALQISLSPGGVVEEALPVAVVCEDQTHAIL